MVGGLERDWLLFKRTGLSRPRNHRLRQISTARFLDPRHPPTLLYRPLTDEAGLPFSLQNEFVGSAKHINIHASATLHCPSVYDAILRCAHIRALRRQILAVPNTREQDRFITSPITDYRKYRKADVGMGVWGYIPPSTGYPQALVFPLKHTI
jgi:hypothetical protein